MLTMPGFVAEASIGRNLRSYPAEVTTSIIGGVVLQDCGILKGFGCAIGPISWCALASLGGADAFCDCVDRASGGDCLDCTACSGSGRGLDPRSRDGMPSTADVAHGRFGLASPGDVTVQPPPPGQGRNTLDRMQQQLDRIERCICPSHGRAPALSRPLPPGLAATIL